MKNNKMIYSDYMETMIPAGFTIKKVLFDKQGNEPYKICKHSIHFIHGMRRTCYIIPMRRTMICIWRFRPTGQHGTP